MQKINAWLLSHQSGGELRMHADPSGKIVVLVSDGDAVSQGSGVCAEAALGAALQDDINRALRERIGADG